MRQALDRALRKNLENTVVKARDIVEIAVKEALQRLGVAEAQVPSYLSEEERSLRNKLRAHARQLGDELHQDSGNKGKQEIERISNEMAYEHWHRMLFARYLEQNNLLMYDKYTPVTLEECFELAEEEPNCKDGWELAGRLAQKMLPQIFRADSPVFKIKLSINHINELENLISALDPKTYQAQDSLGWCYQFWQNKKKKQVNDSGVKIGAQELSPVTQLFTEPYMVSFMLDNALGAWWANKRLTQDDLVRANNEQELRDLAAIPNLSLEYLRFVKNEDTGTWSAAAGRFEKWPKQLSELKILDPCCGSGHFLVAVFLMLVPMRMQLEGLIAKEAVDAVLSDNIHGLELDQRCVELAAFALALEAWRYPDEQGKQIGFRTLPELQLACSGMSIDEAQKEWKNLAKGDELLSDAIAWMQYTFKNAPILGSLIDPNKDLKESKKAPWEILQQAISTKSDASSEAKATAQGWATAAALLADKYQFVVTNPPYLTSIKHGSLLKSCLQSLFPIAHKEIAMSFVDRYLSDSCAICFVMPQNWLYLNGYKSFRKYILNNNYIKLAIGLGENSFINTGASGANVGIFLFYQNIVNKTISTIDLNDTQRDSLIKELVNQSFEKINIDICRKDSLYKIPYSSLNTQLSILETIFQGKLGVVTGDSDKWKKLFWEICKLSEVWKYTQSTVSKSIHYGGREWVTDWKTKGLGMHRPGLDNPSWGKCGVAISQMGLFPVSIYTGEIYDNNTASITSITNNQALNKALYVFSEGEELSHEVKKLDKSRKINNKTFLQVPFDLDKWSKIAEEKYPNGFPQPYSDVLTQWIFHGHPCASVIWDEYTKTTAIGELRQDDTVLQVAVARLLGYQWPAEQDTKMELAPEMRQVMEMNAEFKGLVDDDGIVCIPAVRGEKTAAKRLETILYKAYGDAWTSTIETNLLKAVKAKDLESWIRDKFFEQHCKLFQHRPFIWQVWDGLKDGFSALVNYHHLDYKGLERLIYAYLDDWISIQKADLAEDKDGADIRLTAAENLKVQLKTILEGEYLPGKLGLDIFVRWKPLKEQPIGWNPDLNDGVRLNIRPFMRAKDVGKKGAGLLRAKPNIHWKKDRGSDVESAPWFHLGPLYDEKEGSRINDHHLTLNEKKIARQKLND